MYRERRVSVVFPTYSEKGSIKQAVVDFLYSGFIDEIIVVNNNAEPGTDEEVSGTGARIVYEEKQGYGFAIRKGLREAIGDIIIVSEPDGTFLGRDVAKLLAYSDDFEVVFGTRTTSIMVWSGANMGLFLRIGNIFVAKLMEFLFNTTTLTDMGCTMKLFKKEALKRIEDKFTIGGSCFGAEAMLLTIINGLKFIEIPVNYRPRVGLSQATGNKIVAFFIGMHMIGLILKYRLTSRKKK